MWLLASTSCCLFLVLVWSVGLIVGILVDSNEDPALLHDPRINGMMSIYLMLLAFQFKLLLAAIFGLIMYVSVWRSSSTLPCCGKLQLVFILWFSCLIGAIFGNALVGIYGVARGKEPDGQIGFIYEMFQKNADQPEFITSLESLQKDNSCCGIYGPNDWFKVQLDSNGPKQRSKPAKSTAEFSEQEQEIMEQNPVTGNCHLTPLEIEPDGCGQILIAQINERVILFSALALGETIFGIMAGILALLWFLGRDPGERDDRDTEDDKDSSPKDRTSEVVVVVDSYDDDDDDEGANCNGNESPYGHGQKRIVAEVGDESHKSTTIIEGHGHSQPHAHGRNHSGQDQHKDKIIAATQSHIVDDEPPESVPLNPTSGENSSSGSGSSDTSSSSSPAQSEDGASVQSIPPIPPPPVVQIGYVTKEELQAKLRHHESGHGSNSDDASHANSWKISWYKIRHDDEADAEEHGHLHSHSHATNAHEHEHGSSVSRNHSPSRGHESQTRRKSSDGFDFQPDYSISHYSSRRHHDDDQGSTRTSTRTNTTHGQGQSQSHSRSHENPDQSRYLTQSGRSSPSSWEEPRIENLYHAGSSFNDNMMFSHYEIPSTSTTAGAGSRSVYPYHTHTSFAGTGSKLHGPLTAEMKKEVAEQKLVEKEEKVILNQVLHGGKVVGEIKVEHKFDKDGKPIKNDKTKRATVTIVRKKHVEDPVPPPGHHGQTGHLAEDIAEMSGKARQKIKIEDLALTANGAKAREARAPAKKSTKKMFGSVGVDTAQHDLEDMLSPSHIRHQEALQEKQKEAEQALIKPHYLVVTHPHPERHHGGEDGQPPEHKYFHYLPNNSEIGHQNLSQAEPTHHQHHQSRFEEQHEHTDRDLQRYLNQSQILAESHRSRPPADEDEFRDYDRDRHHEPPPPRSRYLQARDDEPRHHEHEHHHEREREMEDDQDDYADDLNRTSAKSSRGPAPDRHSRPHEGHSSRVEDEDDDRYDEEYDYVNNEDEYGRRDHHHQSRSSSAGQNRHHRN